MMSSEQEPRSAQEKPTKEKPTIFISHRFADRAIADVIRRNLRLWGFPYIYQPGVPGAGPTFGHSLTDELRNVLEHIDLVILVYTFTDVDWSWCMFECGLATQPQQANTTRVVVFQCSKYDSPRQFAQQLNVNVDIEGIRNFTEQVHRRDGFFRDWPAIRPDLHDEDLESFSEAFYEDLRPVIPSGRLEERNRWDNFTLKLEPPTDRLNPEMNEENEDEVVRLIQLIQSELFVANHFGNALEHFGYANLEGDLKLSDLIARWKKETRDRENASNDWIKGLCLEIRRAIGAYPAEPNWQGLNSVRFRGNSYYPVLNHVRVLPDSSMEFDVYFYAVGEEGASA